VTHLGTRHLPTTVLFEIDTRVICAINGAAAGYGFDLALGCDMRLMSDGAKLLALVRSDDFKEAMVAYAESGGRRASRAADGARRSCLTTDAGTAVACFTFDNMGEAAEIGAGTLDAPRPAGTEPSLALGQPRLLDLLDAHSVRATFFLEGWNGVHHPEAVREVVARGHELGMHGWLHETWHELDPARERDLAERATRALEEAAGVRPVGFRAPGGARTASSEAILDGLGYAYDASLGDGMRPALLPGGLAQVPFVWPGVDGFFYLRESPAEPAEVQSRWLEALDKAAARGGLFVLVCHAHITGLDEHRLAALGAVMAAAAADPRIALRTVGEVAAAVRGAGAAPAAG